MELAKGRCPMNNKEIDNLITKRVKKILEKDVLTDDDLKFLILYRKIERETPSEKLFKQLKSLVKSLQNNMNEEENK